MPDPLVSVMMPARNEAEFIADAIASIQIQSYTNWELIVVDDKSTDATREIALAKAAEDDRIRVIEGDGICSGNARNKAIRNARGEYIMNMDADDVSAPTRIEKLVAEARRHPNTVVGSFMAMVDLDLNVQRVSTKPIDDTAIRKQLRRWWGRSAILPQTMLFPTELIRRYMYNEFYRVMVDWDLVLRLAENGDVIFRNVPEPLYFYRPNRGSMTLNPTPRIRYNLLLRYNERQRKRGRQEIRDLDVFESMVRRNPLRRLVYGTLFLAKQIQHKRLRRRMRFGY